MSSKKTNTKSKTKKPPVREVKIIEEDDDKRVIVFVTIAILAIVGIVIGFLVGCQKKEEEKTPEDVTPEKEEVIKKDEVVNLDEDTDLDTIVTKTSTKTTEKNKYTIIFNWNDGSGTSEVKVEDGNKVTPLLPKGYSSCVYYDDQGEAFDFSKGIYGNTNILMTCELISYSVEYDPGAGTNPTAYNVEVGEVELASISETDKQFVGWYTNKVDGVYSNKITSLSPSIIDYADSTDNIKLYGRLESILTLTYHTPMGPIAQYVYSATDFGAIVNDQATACSTEEKLLGWSATEGSRSINYNIGESITLYDDLDIYPVCGSTTVTYVSEGEVVEEVGLTDAEVEEYELPDDQDLGLEAPTYFVKVDTETETTKKVVANDKVDFDENKEVKIGDITPDRVAENAVPTDPIVEDDIVEEKEMEFNGWTIDEDEDPTTPDVPVLDDYQPPVNEDVELHADWVQQEEDRIPDPGPTI